MSFCAASGSFQKVGSSDFAFSSARRRVAVSTSKMPPQQPDRLLDVFDELQRFGAHANHSVGDDAARDRSDARHLGAGGRNVYAAPRTHELPPVSLASVKAFLAERAPDLHVIETAESSATVALAAAAHGVEPAQIAKTLSLRIAGRVVLLVTSGTARLDNRKVKNAFGSKPRMLDAAEVEVITGHPVGGVCPFGLATPLPVYCDVSLKTFDEVVPAAGSANSAVRIAPERLAALAGATWVDAC